MTKRVSTHKIDVIILSVFSAAIAMATYQALVPPPAYASTAFIIALLAVAVLVLPAAVILAPYRMPLALIAILAWLGLTIQAFLLATAPIWVVGLPVLLLVLSCALGQAVALVIEETK